jgi:hypothetical protein
MPEGPSVFDVIGGILSLLAAVWAAGAVYKLSMQDLPDQRCAGNMHKEHIVQAYRCK